MISYSQVHPSIAVGYGLLGYAKTKYKGQYENFKAKYNSNMINADLEVMFDNPSYGFTKAYSVGISVMKSHETIKQAIEFDHNKVSFAPMEPDEIDSYNISPIFGWYFGLQRFQIAPYAGIGVQSFVFDQGKRYYLGYTLRLKFKGYITNKLALWVAPNLIRSSCKNTNEEWFAGIRHGKSKYRKGYISVGASFNF